MKPPGLQALVARLRRPDLRRLALVGLAKNCGKTTTLNALLLALRPHRSLGLCSIGIDGESRDALIGSRKPRIRVEEGDWVLTTGQALGRSGARLELHRSMGWSTPMGEALVGRVCFPGEILLAGIRHSEDLRQGLDVLGELGADLTFVDGAYGRAVAARADLVDAILLSTGAVLGAQAQMIVEATEDRFSRLALRPIEAPWQRELMQQSLTQQRALLGGPAIASRRLPRDSALLGLEPGRALFDEHIEALAVPGLVSDRVLEELLGLPTLAAEAEDSGLASQSTEPIDHRSDRQVSGELPRRRRVLLVGDGSQLQAERALWRRFRGRWDVRASQSVPIIGMSFNPTGVQGNQLPSAVLEAALREAFERLPIFDPLQIGYP